MKSLAPNYLRKLIYTIYIKDDIVQISGMTFFSYLTDFSYFPLLFKKLAIKFDCISSDTLLF